MDCTIIMSMSMSSSFFFFMLGHYYINFELIVIKKCLKIITALKIPFTNVLLTLEISQLHSDGAGIFLQIENRVAKIWSGFSHQEYAQTPYNNIPKALYSSRTNSTTEAPIGRKINNGLLLIALWAIFAYGRFARRCEIGGLHKSKLQ